MCVLQYTVPYLEVNRKTPLGDEGVVARVFSQAQNTGLRTTLLLKLAHKLHAYAIFLKTTKTWNLSNDQ